MRILMEIMVVVIVFSFCMIAAILLSPDISHPQSFQRSDESFYNYIERTNARFQREQLERRMEQRQWEIEQQLEQQEWNNRKYKEKLESQWQELSDRGLQ